MIKCNGCIHLPVCSSREEKCQHYQSKTDIYKEFVDDFFDNGKFSFYDDVVDIRKTMNKLIEEMENE